MKQILFRCDVSPKTGTGHIRRCLVLAEEIQNLGGQVCFLLKSKDMDPKSFLSPMVEHWKVLNWEMSPEDELQKMVQIYTQRNMDAMVIDHYEADSDYQRRLFNSGIKWLQFDGCSGKSLWADWVLNPSPASRTCDYGRFLRRDDTRLLLGPKFAFLRQEFRTCKGDLRFKEIPEKILITMGGGDDRGAVILCLNALDKLRSTYECVVLTTRHNPRNQEIFNWVSKNPDHVKVIVDEPEVARRMVEADIGIIAGGMTTFETAAMGLPSIIIQIAENQKRNAAAWNESGVAIDMGRLDQLNEDAIRSAVEELIDNAGQRKLMHVRGMSLVDCEAGARVAKLLLGVNRNNEIDYDTY